MSITASEAIHSIQPVKRFLPGSKLFDVTGSVAKRQAHKAMLHESFNKLLEDAFEKSNEISFDELKTIYRKVIPDINVITSSLDDLFGNINPVWDKNKKGLKGWSLGFKLKNDKLSNDLNEKMTIEHENEHLFTTLTEHKYLTDYFFNSMTNKKRGTEVQFYSKFLYEDITHITNGLDKETKNKAYEILMEQFFEKYKIKDYNSVDFLKRWRYRLMDEKSAYSHQINSVLGEKYPDKAIKEIEYYADHFDFNGKISVVEKMFLERVAKVRAEQKRLYGKT